jgi:hypothetical protein
MQWWPDLPEEIDAEEAEIIAMLRELETAE